MSTKIILNNCELKELDELNLLMLIKEFVVLRYQKKFLINLILEGFQKSNNLQSFQKLEKFLEDFESVKLEDLEDLQEKRNALKENEFLKNEVVIFEKYVKQLQKDHFQEIEIINKFL